MRYSVYKFIYGLANSMCEAVSHVKVHHESIALLNDCTDALLLIKNSLDNQKDIIDKEIFDIMDNFFSVMESIIDKANRNEDCVREIDSIYDIIFDIKKFIENKLKYKFKIVFFAELGSKWDSMDSVYRAVKDREDCEVEVVIAPIFRAVKYPNGEIKSDVIYEDFLTPMGISHTLFKNYDIKTDLPDITFTSQPYESVTPEQFWAENVAPYTHLVYLPYFTTSDAFTDEDIYVQCQMPIHRLAWKVICQSEKVKEFYSRFSETKGNNFIATGLPKWDWVVNMDKRDIKRPKEWDKLKDKKVMLLNVHYNLKDKPEVIIDNIRKMLSIDKNSIGIIFRFHPLMDTMFNVYYTQYKEEWEKLILDINNSENCVVDNNVMYDYSFKYSDFLFSSRSSIISQYLLTGKPIIIRDDKVGDYNSENIFVDYFNIGFATTPDRARQMRRLLLDGVDNNKNNRERIIREEFFGADGNIGKRIVDLLIDELLKEDV